jgi:hypothetical protein
MPFVELEQIQFCRGIECRSSALDCVDNLDSSAHSWFIAARGETVTGAGKRTSRVDDRTDRAGVGWRALCPVPRSCVHRSGPDLSHTPTLAHDERFRALMLGRDLLGGYLMLRQEPRYLVLIGRLAGIGLENKYSVVFPLAALPFGMADRRRSFFTTAHRRIAPNRNPRTQINDPRTQSNLYQSSLSCSWFE